MAMARAFTPLTTFGGLVRQNKNRLIRLNEPVVNFPLYLRLIIFAATPVGLADAVF
jgi:hypothetical protein